MNYLSNEYTAKRNMTAWQFYLKNEMETEMFSSFAENCQNLYSKDLWLSIYTSQYTLIKFNLCKMHSYAVGRYFLSQPTYKKVHVSRRWQTSRRTSAASHTHTHTVWDSSIILLNELWILEVGGFAPSKSKDHPPEQKWQ